MRLEEACVRFNKLAGIRFKELFNQDDMDMIITNKGKTGQLLELALGMHLSSTNLDFEDGELQINVILGEIRGKRFLLHRLAVQLMS